MTTTRRFAPFARLAGAAACLLTLAAAAPAPKPFVPVLRQDFPDPFVLEHDGRYFAYATNSFRGRENLQMAVSDDLATWRPVSDPARPAQRHDAMPVLGAWAQRGHTWAPEVLKANGRFILYYTARHKATDQQCVGTAIASKPIGPFVDDGKRPLVCQHDLGGTIDASPFRDGDGSLYLYYKNDGNHPSANKPSQLWGQRLSPDGLRVIGNPVPLLRNDRPWEGRVVEAPTMARHSDGYTMLFSANDYGWQDHQRLSLYAMGYARCQGPLGPCTDAPENPILYSYRDRIAGCLSGPGHQTLLEASGRAFLVFHAWSSTAGCRPANKGRYMYIAPLRWKGGKPLIAPSLRLGGTPKSD